MINARRDLVMRWVRTHVNKQTTNYQKAGEKREKELNTGQYQRTDAINALAQREEYRGLHPSRRPAYDRSKPDVARQLADFVANPRAGALDRLAKIKKRLHGRFSPGTRDTTARTALPSKRPATRPSTPRACGPRTASSRDRAGGSDSRRSWAGGSGTRRNPTSSGAWSAPRRPATASSRTTNT